MPIDVRPTALLTALLLLSAHAAADVRLEGVKGELADNIRAHLRLDEEPCDQEPVRVRYRFEQSEQVIRRALKPFGYYEPGIEATLDFPANGCWRAEFRIDPGPPVMISDVDLEVLGEGVSLPVFQRLMEGTSIQPGTQLDHGRYEDLKDGLLVAAREYGFFDARLVENEIAVNVSARTADVRLIMDTGDRYRFGDLDVSGGGLDALLVKRYIDFQSGGPFEQRRLRKLQNDLVRSDYFTSVDVRTIPQEDRTVDVVLLLEEGRRYRYGVGVGYGTDTGLIVRGDWVQRRVNSRGHRLELDTELSKVRQNLTGDYRIPGRRPQYDWYSFYGGINREDTDAIERIAWKTGIRENRFHTIHWNSTPFVEFVVERYLQDGEWLEQTSLVPGWGIQYLNANEPSRPTRGIRLKAEVAGAAEKVLSSASFVRLLFTGKSILPLGKRGRIITRGEAGWMETNDFDDVPPTWRFFAGGDRSVRGYDYQSLGPLDDEGKAIGGRMLLTASVEGDWRVRERWSAAVFADAGNVGEENLLDNLPWSIGAGVRWYSPVGPIRLDFAFPQEGGNDFRIHISMGPDL
ncbi:MAG: autotransporter assembly complex family protein [Pseudomonadales bacterium]